MEFKGTKGKWKITSLDDTFIRSKENNAFICTMDEANNIKNESRANALLISKAPEMLEMLQKCHFEFGRFKAEFGQGSELENQVLQLIKDATEL